MSTRHIFKSATSGPRSALDALVSILAQEILVPSTELHLMSPWVSDIVIFDNRTGGFDGLDPGWSRREIRLSEVLTTIAAGNTRLVLRVRPDDHNLRFRTRLMQSLDDAGLGDRCDWTERAELHTKGLLTDRVLISGSMNFTENGIRFNDESLTITFEREHIARARLEFQSHGV